jgi:tRNA U34 5-methylaminomethyl-2-thiouridine-forming methyltransferase MnmC
MNVVLAEHSTEAGDEVFFQVARIPTTPPQLRAFTLVRFGRAGLLPATSLLDEAARLLG